MRYYEPYLDLLSSSLCVFRVTAYFYVQNLLRRHQLSFYFQMNIREH